MEKTGTQETELKHVTNPPKTETYTYTRKLTS